MATVMGEDPHTGPMFDGVRIGRPAAGALRRVGYRALPDLPENLEELLSLHGVGPRAIRILGEARNTRRSWG
jgi:hypothetical protein